MTNYDLVVLGGGNAIAIAVRAGNRGMKVAVIEQDRLGGTCPNRGCIPSKLLLGHSETANAIRESGKFHIDAAITSIDGDRILRESKSATFDATDGKIAKNLPDGVDLIRGEGHFVGPRTIAVGDRTVRGETCVVATGTRPRVPPIPGLAGTPYWTSDDVFETESMPKSIVIVGGGYIACELATFFHGVGVPTTMLVRGNTLLRAEDDDIRAVFTEGFTSNRDVRFKTSITQVTHDGSGFELELTGPEGSSTTRSAAFLLAAGRVPNTDRLDLDKAGVDIDSEGNVIVDERLRTTAEGVFCLGDLTGEHLFTHAAAWEANYLGDCLLDGHDEDLDYGPMPHAVFAHPEIAGVGATESELRNADTPYVVASLPYTSAAKGRAIKETHGRCKVLLNPDGVILGCHIVGRDASVLLHEVIPVMKWRNHISSLTEIIHIHPSLSEVVRNTARKAAAALASS